MTDRHGAYLVVLEKPLREDDAEATLTALRQIRGVLSVKPVLDSMEQDTATARVRMDFFRDFQARARNWFDEVLLAGSSKGRG